jgi:hypothetical protein
VSSGFRPAGPFLAQGNFTQRPRLIWASLNPGSGGPCCGPICTPSSNHTPARISGMSSAASRRHGRSATWSNSQPSLTASVGIRSSCSHRPLVARRLPVGEGAPRPRTRPRHSHPQARRRIPKPNREALVKRIVASRRQGILVQHGWRPPPLRRGLWSPYLPRRRYLVQYSSEEGLGQNPEVYLRMLGIRHIYDASHHPQTQGLDLSQREPHWNVTVLVPSELVTRLDVIGCEPYFRQ